MLYVLYEGEIRSVIDEEALYESSCGNMVDVLPHDYHAKQR